MNKLVVLFSGTMSTVCLTVALSGGPKALVVLGVLYGIRCVKHLFSGLKGGGE